MRPRQALMLLAAVTFCGPPAVMAETIPPRFAAVQRTVSLKREVLLRYLVHLPQAYGKDDRPWPLLLYLHGGMGRGDDFGKMAWYPPIRMASEGASLPFILVAPQCPEGETWNDPETLVAVLDEVLASHRVDSSRIYLAGYSMGGEGAWFLAYLHPERFAAVAPMSGPRNPWWADHLAGVSIWAFHGARDDRVPVSETEAMVAAIRKAGGDVRVSIDPERGHSPPSDAEHEALWAWFLEHRRPPAPSAMGAAATPAPVADPLGLPVAVDPSGLVLFYLHGRIVEEQGPEAVSPDYGPYRFKAITEALAAHGSVVISEVRPKGAEVDDCARRVVRQIEALRQRGVPASHITVVGASKGGAIAAHVASLVGDTGVNTVLLAICNGEMEQAWARDGLCVKGNVLSIYDAGDAVASSCRPLFERCAAGLEDRGEITLSVGSGHGVLYQPLPAWIEPTVAWARAHALDGR